MEDTKLIAKKRALQGSSNMRRLRRAGTLPGVIYGDGKEGAAIQLDMHDFAQLLHHHASETVLVEIEVEGEGVVTAPRSTWTKRRSCTGKGTPERRSVRC